jgi:hypothetical protein
MVRLALVSPRWGGPSHTLTARRITTEREVFRKSFLIFSLSTISNSILDTFSSLSHPLCGRECAIGEVPRNKLQGYFQSSASRTSLRVGRGTQR